MKVCWGRLDRKEVSGVQKSGLNISVRPKKHQSFEVFGKWEIQVIHECKINQEHMPGALGISEIH